MKNIRAAESLGKIVRDLRKKKGWTQEDLAGELDVAASWISLIERGKKNPSLETILRIAVALDVNVWFGDKRL